MEEIARLKVEGKLYIAYGDVDEVQVTIVDHPGEDKAGGMSLFLTRDEWKNVLKLLEGVV